MTTAITADDLLRAFTKRGVRFRFYKDKADFLTHNRNFAGANAGATPGGFGPIRGLVWHNTAMTSSEKAQLAYLYTGDGPYSGKPGPLCTGAVTADGTVVLMGWGACTHAGPGDAKVEALLRADAMPLDGERRPTTSITSAGTVQINAFYLGWEVLGTSVNATQRKTLVLLSAAILEMLGGPSAGYSGGSIAMHRELTTTRSDPVGIAKDGSGRREVNALLRSWAAAATPPAAPKPTSCTVTLSTQRITSHDKVTVTAAVSPAVPGTFRFDWSYPGASSWTQFGSDQPSSSGRASLISTPGADIVYRARFYPVDGKAYAIAWSPNVALDVVTLADVEKLEAEIADLQSKLDAQPAAS
jgi:hypothetical protein